MRTRCNLRFSMAGLAAALALVVLLMSQAPSAYAAPSCPPTVGTSCLASVTPTAIPNTANITVTVQGQGFTNAPNNPVVQLNGTPLATTFVNANTLTAVVPAGLPGEINGLPYTITAINGDGTASDGSLTLLIMRPAPTETPTPTATATPFVRPIVAVLSYAASAPVLYPGQEIDFEITLQNTGALTARNVIVVFGRGDLLPRDMGGLRAVGDIPPGGTVRFSQPMRVDSSVGNYEAVIDIQIRYTDEYGVQYTDSSTLSFEAARYAATPTPTATLSVRPQLIVEDYRTTPDLLAPGTIFDLELDVVNASGELARQVVITLKQSETSLRVIAPLSTGNVRYIEQMMPGERAPIRYQLAVNGNAEGGLVPINLELSYMDNYNVQHTETQTISLPVQATPHLQVRLFEPLPDLIQIGDTFEVAVEVINIGTQSVNVSTVELVSDKRLTIEGGSVYIGPLDPGTTGTLIATVTAHQAGAASIDVRVNYLNSFQQPEVLTQTIDIEVEAIPTEGALPGGSASQAGGGRAGGGELSVGQRLWRALLGFLGLGTRPPEATLPGEPRS